MIKMTQNCASYDILPQSLDKSPANFSVISEIEECYASVINWCIPKSDHKAVFKYRTLFSVLISEHFDIGNNNCKFYMKLYLNGKEKSSRNFVSLVIVFCSRLPKNAWVEGTVSISGRKTTTFSKGGDIQQIVLNSLDGSGDLCNYLEANDLVIQCSMKMKFKTVKCMCDNNSVTYDLSRKHDSHGKTLFKTKLFFDVTFCLQGKEIKAHKAKLLGVPYFERLFEDESRQLFELSGIDFNIFEQVLEFIYTNELPSLNSTLTCQLYVVADELEITRLKVLCASYLGANLAAKNVVIILFLADKCNDYSLKKECFEFITKSNSEILAKLAEKFA